MGLAKGLEIKSQLLSDPVLKEGEESLWSIQLTLLRSMGAQSCKDSIFGVTAIYIITSHEIWKDVQGFVS